jgi:hypothetical protein
LGLATSIAAGRDLGTWKSHGAFPTLVVDGEMPLDGCLARLDALGEAPGLHLLNHQVFFHETGLSLNIGSATTQEAILALCVENGFKVLLLDNLSCLASGVAENEADSWDPLQEWILKLRRHGITVILVLHSGRNGQARGTSKREDAAFWVLRLEAGEKTGTEKTAAFTASFSKERNSGRPQPPIQWTFTTGPDGKATVTAESSTPLEVFRSWLEAGLDCATDIAAEMQTSKGTISKLATKAEEAGWLRKQGRRYALVS